MRVGVFSNHSCGMGYAPTWAPGPQLRRRLVQGCATLDHGVWRSLRSLPTPAPALSGVHFAVISRLTRAAILENLRQDFIRTARAKRVAERSVLVRHALKNSAVPVLTENGLGVGAPVSGSAILENAVASPGLGPLTVDAAPRHDAPMIQAAAPMFGALHVALDLAVDLSCTRFDPRSRCGWPASPPPGRFAPVPPWRWAALPLAPIAPVGIFAPRLTR